MATKNKQNTGSQTIDGMNSMLDGLLKDVGRARRDMEKMVGNLPKLTAQYSKPFQGGVRASLTALGAVVLEFETQAKAKAFYDGLAEDNQEGA
jgi:hypothetical protein